MLKAKTLKIPDFSEYVGRTFVFERDFDPGDSNISFCKGMKFKIKKIKNGDVHFRIVSDVKECMPAIEKFAAIVAADKRKEIATFDKIINIWKTEGDKFVKDPASFWNKDDGHTINTGYDKVPMDHPDKGKSTSKDTIQTFDYKHTGGRKNIYSYQEGKNEWYSQACYEFMRLGAVEELEEFEKLSEAKRKDIHQTYYVSGFLAKYDMSIKDLNKAKFKLL
jgi:hypothetical protein